jgi:hypothetical protein
MFKVVLTNGSEDAAIEFSLRNTDIARKWYAELRKNYDLYEKNRLTNWNTQSIIKELNNAIDIINEYDSIIDMKVSLKTNQKDLNYLHKFFENLRGEVNVSTDWYKAAPQHIRQTLDKFNILIHQLEEQIRSPNYPTLVVTFKDRPNFELTEEDQRYFTFNWNKGTVYINYCHVGKTVLDVFNDRDEIASIRPQTHYSADFMVKFGPSTLYPVFIFKKLIIKAWLLLQNFSFKYPNIGYIPVADMVGEFDIEKFRKYNEVKEVVCAE